MATNTGEKVDLSACEDTDLPCRPDCRFDELHLAPAAQRIIP